MKSVAKYCPLTDDDVVYLECLECENQMCRRDYESERFYLFVAGSWFDAEALCRAVAGKVRKKKQIIIISPLKYAETFAEKTGMIFRRSADPVQDCLVLMKKPDSGAIVFADGRRDERLAEKLKRTGIRTHVVKKGGN